MIDIDIDAIRKRDAAWLDTHPMRESAGRDRHALLLYINELEALTEEIATDIGLIKKKHREGYQPRPPELEPSEVLVAQGASGKLSP